MHSFAYDLGIKLAGAEAVSAATMPASQPLLTRPPVQRQAPTAVPPMPEQPAQPALPPVRPPAPLTTYQMPARVLLPKGAIRSSTPGVPNSEVTTLPSTAPKPRSTYKMQGPPPLPKGYMRSSTSGVPNSEVITAPRAASAARPVQKPAVRPQGASPTQAPYISPVPRPIPQRQPPLEENNTYRGVGHRSPY